MKPESFQKYDDVYIVNELMNTYVGGSERASAATAAIRER